MHVTNKFVPKHPNPPPPPEYWNELLFPREFPLAFFEMSFLLPHFLKEGRGKLDVYFTRVYNPLWTNPDGFSWMEMLQDKRQDRPARRADADLERDRVVCRLHPADGPRHRAPRHDEPGDARRPVARLPPAGAARRAREARRDASTATLRSRIRARCGRRASSGSRSPGRSIPTARSASASSSSRPYRPGEQITMDEYYGWMFENSVPGLPEAAAQEKPDAARLHAQVRRVPGVGQRLQPRTSAARQPRR